MTTESGYLFTSESVTEGHPDKISDQISDAVLDAALTADPTARVACETLVTTGLVVVAGEITTNAVIDYSRVARETVREIGYTRAKYGFDCDTCAVLSALDRQSPDIAMGGQSGSKPWLSRRSTMRRSQTNNYERRSKKKSLSTPSRRNCSTKTRSITSIPPDDSSPAVRRVTPA